MYIKFLYIFLSRSSSVLQELNGNASPTSSDVERQKENKDPPIVFWWKIVVMASCLVAVVTDPLFLYIPFINEERKCLRVDKRLRTVALILRSLTDLIFIIDIVYQVHERMKARERASGSTTSRSKYFKKQAKEDKWKFRVSMMIHILALLPLPQISVLVIFFRITESRYLQTTKALNFFLLLQYVPNILRVRHAYKELHLVEKFVSCAFNFFLYVVASHVIGAFWYYFSVKREISCWLQACRSIAGSPGCIIALCNSNSTPTYDIFLDISCPLNPSNATIFNFGMFLDTIQSGFATQKTSPSKVFYYFWWGLKNLSNFGTNLQTSSYLWENCFTILISITGLLLFLYLIGNVQTYMNFSKSREIQEEEQSRKMIEKENAIHQYVDQIKGLSQHEKSDIIANIRRDALKTKLASTVDMDLLLSIVHINTAKNIKLLVGKHAMMKVKMLQNMDVDVLEKMCEYLVPVSYIDGHEFKIDSAIKSMLFVIKGEISHVTNHEPAAGEISASQQKPASYFGSELLQWVSPSISCINLEYPKRDRGVSCKGEVEVFALHVKDLKTVVENFKEKWNWCIYRCDIESPPMSELTCPREMNDDTSTVYIDKWKDELIKQQRVNIRNDIENWLTSTHLGDEDVHRKIKGHIEKIDVEKKKEMGVLMNLDIIFPLLSEDIQSNIAMNALKRVEFFKGKPDYMLKPVSKCLKPKIFQENSYVATLDKKLDSILFVMEGFIGCTDVSADAAITSGYIPRLYFMKDTVYGENLLSWASTPSNTIANIPFSTQEFKCFEKVQAFILKVSELKNVASKFDKWAQVFSAPNHESKTSLQIMKDVHTQLNDTAWKDMGNEDFKKLMKFMSKEKELLDWLLKHISSEDLTTKVMKNIKKNKVVEEHEDLPVDLNYLFSVNLSSTIQKDLVDHLCVPILNEIDLLKEKPAILKSMCDNLKPMVYQNNELIVKKGYALEMILIVIDGQIKMDDDDSVSNQAVPDKTSSKSGNFIYFEEDLLEWFSSENKLAGSDPISCNSIRCQTKVEAFVLPISKLRCILSANINEWMSNLWKKRNQASSTTHSNESIRAKENQINKWLLRNGFNKKLKKYFWFHVTLNNAIENNIDAEIDLEYIISSLKLPLTDIVKPMTEHLCMGTLRKVLMVKENQVKILVKMCSHMEVKVYKEKEQLIGKGEPLGFVFVIVEGVIEVSDAAGSKAKPITKTRGDFIGESLLNWASPPAMFLGETPTATRDVRCQTKVEVFRLSTNHLKSVVSEYSPDWKSIIEARKAQQQTSLKDETDQKYEQYQLGIIKSCEIDLIENKELRKDMKNKFKEDNILKWMSNNDFSEELKKSVMLEIQVTNAFEQVRDVNSSLKFMLSIRGENGQITKSITECLCMGLLRKVPMLERMHEAVLKRISSHVEAVYLNVVVNKEEELPSVKKGEILPFVKKGDILPFVLFIVEGEIECTNNTSEVEVKNSQTITKKKGDFLGEEIFHWASPEVMFIGSAPISTVDVKCRQRVQGFKLTAEKLRQVVYEHKREWDSTFASCIHPQQLEDVKVLRANIDKKYKQMQLEKIKVDDIEDAELRKAVKIKIKENDIDKWMSDNGFSEELKELTKLEIQKKNAIELDMDTDMYLKFLLRLLESTKNKKMLTHHFCFCSLKKVPMLERLQENVFRKIFDHVDGFFLNEGEFVVKKGAVIPFVLIIVEGVIEWSDMANDAETIVTKKKGDIFGEELLNYAFHKIMFFEPQPTSNVDVVCRKRLQGFKLTRASLTEAVKDCEVERHPSYFGTKDYDSLENLILTEEDIPIYKKQKRINNRGKRGERDGTRRISGGGKRKSYQS